MLFLYLFTNKIKKVIKLKQENLIVKVFNLKMKLNYINVFYFYNFIRAFPATGSPTTTLLRLHHSY